jgi:hypothetical protein
MQKRSGKKTGEPGKDPVRQNFDYAWSLYEGGLRGTALVEKVSLFLKGKTGPEAGPSPMQCVADFIKAPRVVSPEEAARCLLLAVEFAPYALGLRHQVIRASAVKAGLIPSEINVVTKHIVEKARRLVAEKAPPPLLPTIKAVATQGDSVSKAHRPDRAGDGRSREIDRVPVIKEPGRKRLVELFKGLTPDMKTFLKKEKAKARDLERPDFIWYVLLKSLAAMGNSRDTDQPLLSDEHYQRMTFEVLNESAPEERQRRLEETFRQAGVTAADQKAEWASDNHVRIATLGGIEKARKAALSQKGQRAKITFMKRFRGIGEKQAKSIWMDVFHQDFRNSIAIDERTRQVAAAAGHSFSSPEEQEKFFLEVAEESGLTGWEVDRLISTFRDHFLKALST